MIIKGVSTSPRKKSTALIFLLSIAFLGIALWWAYGYSQKAGMKGVGSTTHTHSCGAENVNSDKKFINKGVLFNNGHTQSSEEVYKGRYSSKIDSNNLYSFSLDYTDFKANDEIEITVWYRSVRRGTVYLVAQSQNPKFYAQSNEDIDNKNGWFQKRFTFTVPKLEGLDKLKLFAYSSNKQDVTYLDEFIVVNKTQKLIAEGYESNLKVESAQLHLSVKALEKLQKKRTDALQLGILVKGDNDWVKAKFKSDNLEEVEVKARLKGDWTDHLKGNTWSYRIKMPAEKAWNRITTFSLQNPVTRDYLSEWVFHQFLTKEDILTPRYDFIKLRINDNNSRVYAYEEHFEKQIAEYKNRREGVVIRYSEEEFWNARRRDKELGSNYFHSLPNFHYKATIAPFGESKIGKNEKLLEQYQAASNLLFGFQKYELSVSEVFDVDRLAKYYALCEIVRAYHSTIWHNTRFYYNPIIKKLEPIGFDGFTETGSYDFHKNAFFGAYRSSSLKDISQNPDNYIFQDKDFNKAYTQYLKTFSSREYLDNFLTEIALDLNQREQLIQEEKPGYNYKKNEIYKTCKNIKAALKVVHNISMLAYRSHCDIDSCEVQITNYHALPLEFIGSSKGKNDFEELQKTTLVFANRRVNTQEFTTLKIPKTHKYIHYRLAGDETTYYSEIKAWTSPQIKKGNVLNTLQMPLAKEKFSVSENKVYINLGHHTITSPIIIPAGMELEVGAGSTLDFTEKAYLLSYGPVLLQGSENNPITITSSDKSSQGFHVLNAKMPSTLMHTQFLQLNTLSEDDWQLTGAVTFYESQVNLDKVTISHNLCEDALNIIRSDFKAIRLHINNTFADGFDADFCTGTLKNSKFYNTGNDGIDFSGCTIEVENITLHKIGDKGISAGEQATLTVTNADIKDAVIGVASKDLSKVIIKNIDLKNCNKGFAAYQKKPEFGPGHIKVEKYTAEEVKFLQIAEDNSTIELPASK